MGETISTLVFRPPPPTPMDPDRVFFLDVDTSQDSSAFSCGKSQRDLEEDGVQHKIACFFIKRRNAQLTVLFSHGNAEDLGMMYKRMKQMARTLCVNIMAYDYSGYGKSSGEPSEEMCYRNIDAAYNYLLNIRKINPSKIVLYGRSLGSGPSSYLAAKSAQNGNSVAGLILHSPFLSVYRVVVDCGVTLVGDMFPNISNIPKVRCPTLIIHGTKDEVVPFWHGQKLLSLLPEEYRAQPFWADGWGHNNIEVYLKKLYTEKVNNFLDRYIATGRRDGRRVLQPTIGSHGPIFVPEAERAVKSDTQASSQTFFVNSTWVRHGAHIINEAFSSKKTAEDARKRNQSSNVHIPTIVNQETETRDPPEVTSPRSRYRAQHLRSPRRAERVNRFITTMDDFFPDDRDENESPGDNSDAESTQRRRRKSKDARNLELFHKAGSAPITKSTGQECSKSAGFSGASRNYRIYPPTGPEAEYEERGY